MHSRGARRSARMLLVVAIASAPWMVGASGAARDLSSTSVSSRIAVIVQSAGGAAGAARAVTSVGGKVTRRLPIVEGVSASINRSTLAALQAAPGVVSVTPDEKVGFDGAAAKPANATAHIPDIVNATKLWNSGYKGQGVTIALLDTGVYAAHPDLQGQGGSRVVHCEDFSHERGTAAECQDTFGHGTFMAGLMAGNGASSKGKYSGTAPAAKIVSVKVAGFDGSTDISQILAGIQWIVAHRDTYGDGSEPPIRVLNLSLGSDSGQDYRLSPLNFAVERAWQAGIVTVVSAGNSGDPERTIHKPADDPYVVTVGASNDEGTRTLSDDRIPVFSSRGRTKPSSYPLDGIVKPDVVAPGVKTISLRSPGSAIDQKYGDTARVKSEYFRGTGTSMATAVTSGAVALILQRAPGLVPDQVKFRLMDTARQIVDTDPKAAGKGVIDAFRAATSTSTNLANQGIEPATGLGLLELDRGSLHVDVKVALPPGRLALTGEFVAQTDPSIINPLNPASLVPWLDVNYTLTGWDPASWDDTTWATEQWLPTVWQGDQAPLGWEPTVDVGVNGTQWRGTQWRNEDWDGTQWRGTQWRYTDFDGTQWRATTWQSKWYAVAWN
jgi:serine protease AprX